MLINSVNLSFVKGSDPDGKDFTADLRYEHPHAGENQHAWAKGRTKDEAIQELRRKIVPAIDAGPQFDQKVREAEAAFN